MAPKSIKIAKKVYKKKTIGSSRITTQGLTKLVKKINLKESETKNVPNDGGKVELYHNSGSPASGRILPTPYALDGPNQQPAQGVSDVQRIGDKITMRGIKVRLLLGQKFDRMNVTFKVLVVRVNSDQVPTTVADLFDNQTGNIMLDSVNTDRVKVVYNKTIKKVISPQLDVSGGAKELTHFHKFYLRNQRNISYSANTGKDFSGKKHYLYVFAYDAYGSLVTDNIGYCQVYSNVYFKDL